MSNYPSLSASERKVFSRLPRWRYERRRGGIRRVALFLNCGGKAMGASALKDIGRFLNFDGADDVKGHSQITVELNVVSSHGVLSSVSQAREILCDQVRATGRQLEFCVTLSPKDANASWTRGLAQLRIPIILRWDGRNRQLLEKAVVEAHAQEVVLLLAPSWAESLDRVIERLAELRVPSISLQMEYARRWSMYDYHVIEQAVRRFAETGWRVGRTTIRLCEPMCRRPRGVAYCGAGVTKVAIGAEGVLYPCHRFVGDRRRAIGAAALGFWPGVLRLYHYRPEQNEGCQGCALVGRCDTGCVWLNLRETGRMDKTTSAVCEFAKTLYAGAP